MVAEFAGQRVLGHDAEPDLVGDEHHGPGERAAAPRTSAAVSCSHRAAGLQQIGRARASGSRPGSAGPARASRMSARGEVERLLERRPVPAAARAVAADALRHLAVARLGGGEIERGRGRGLDHALGIAALARARAAQHQQHARECCGGRRNRRSWVDSFRQDVPPPEDHRLQGRDEEVSWLGVVDRGTFPAGSRLPVALYAAISPLTVAGAAPASHRTSLSHRGADASTRRGKRPGRGKREFSVVGSQSAGRRVDQRQAGLIV